jgi:hypothetical protein
MKTPRTFTGMSLFVNSAAVVAMLAIAPASWAQGRAGDMPQGGNTMGMPGPNPGGPSNATIGNQPAAAAAPMQAHHKHHMTAHRKKSSPLTGSTTEQLNQEELARLQAGGPPPPTAGGAMPPPMGQTGMNCPPGMPWVPAGYGNGKFIPGHCQGQPAQ